MFYGDRDSSYQVIKGEDVEVAEIVGEDVNIVNEETNPCHSIKSHSPFLIFGVCMFVFVMLMAFVSITIENSTNKEPLLQSWGKAAVPFKVLSVHPDPPTSFWGDMKKPLPTGAFWTNLVVRNGDGPIGLYPYGVKTLDDGVQASYGAYRRSVSNLAITDHFVCDIQISSVEQYYSRAVENFDSLSMTMTYKAGNGRFKAHLVKSSPFLTVEFENTAPLITSPMQILSVNPKIVRNSIGSQYVVTLGNYQQWLVYCSEPVALVWQKNSLTSPSAIRGVVRIAILPSKSSDEASNLLLGYVHKYPVGATLSLTYPSFGTASTVQWQYNTVGTGKLLMLALPHQTDLFVLPNLETSEMNELQSLYGPIWSIKGKMTPVVGDTWRLQYSAVQVGWHYSMSSTVSTSDLDLMAQHLQEDVKTILPTAPDPYNFGKELGRMSRLVLIADYLGLADARQQALINVEAAIAPWVQNVNPNAFVYDRSYGGVVTSNGVQDRFSDFGNGWYSDHHFHYGYFIFAGAVLARYSSPVFTANKAAFDALVRDVCSQDQADGEFPFARHKDFFDGHSWASGLFTQSNGKGQESSSESINAYYATYLYGQATANRQLTHFAHLLLTMEVQSTKTYWHMPDEISPNSASIRIYDAVFESRRMVGNIGALDVTTSTWFGENLAYVHGINIMPVSPATATLFDKPYVQVEWPSLVSTLPPRSKPGNQQCSANPRCKALGMIGMCCPTIDGSHLSCCEMGEGLTLISNEWESLLFCILAVADRDVAFRQLAGLNGFGSGNSKSNSLLWAASREKPAIGFNSSARTPPITASGINPLCSANSACDAAWLEGNCCPTDDGDMLGCCPKLT